MTLQEYINKLQNYLKENPQYKDCMVIYSKDDEGNAYYEVGDWGPSEGYIADLDDYCFVPLFKHHEEDWEENELTDKDINVVCIN